MLNKKIFRDFSWSQVPKYLGIFLLIFLGILLVAFIAKLAFVYVLYNFFSGMIMSAFGLDLVLARGAGVFLTVVSLLLLPTVISFLLLGRRRKEVLTVSAIIFGVFSASIYYGASDVFFDRQTGQPLKYYIKTLEGFKFSNSDDFDPQLAIKYKQIDAQTAKEYYLWQKTGELQIPQVEKGKYFDRLTGEPIVWYAEREEGKIELFGLPGFDQSTGELLKPISKEVLKNQEVTQLSFEARNTEQSGSLVDSMGKKIDADFVVYIEGNGNPITFKIEPEYIKVAKDQEIQLGVIGYFVSNSMIPGRKPYIIEPQDVVVVELPDKKLYRMSDRVVWHTNADNGYMKFSIHYDANFATAIKKDNGRFIDGAVKIAIKFNSVIVGKGELIPLTETNNRSPASNNTPMPSQPNFREQAIQAHHDRLFGTATPTIEPSPTVDPSASPTLVPSSTPTAQGTETPTAIPSPTTTPTIGPTVTPTKVSTLQQLGNIFSLKGKK